MKDKIKINICVFFSKIASKLFPNIDFSYYETLKKYNINMEKQKYYDRLKTPHDAFYFVRLYIQEKFLPAEKVIATNDIYSYRYANEILKGRFKKGEEIISTNDFYSYRYANEILKGRFEKGEEIISTKKIWSTEYISLIYENNIKIDDDFYKIFNNHFSNDSKLSDYTPSAIFKKVKNKKEINSFDKFILSKDTEYSVKYTDYLTKNNISYDDETYDMFYEYLIP